MPEISPVFVVGAGRSGTTPLQLALNMHPRLGVYGETQAFFVHRRFGAETGESRLARLLKHWRPMVASCSPYEGLLDGSEMHSKLSNASSYAEILDVIFGAIAKREGKDRWGEKSPAHVFRLPEIRSCFPRSQIVHIIRDPRAAVSSAIKAFGNGDFSDWNVYRAARYWMRCFTIHSQQQTETTPELYTLVRYEDFVSQPENTLRRVSSFLGMNFVPEMLQAHRRASKYVQKENSGDMPAHHSLTQKPFDASRADAWKKVLSPEQTKLVEQVAAKPMEKLGYERSRSREYQPPRMRAVYFSTRWIAAEGRRIADKQARAPYWALQRIIESREREPAAAETAAAESVTPQSLTPMDAKPAPKRASVSSRPDAENDQLRRSGTQ